jgi:hypothetical protein
VWLWCIRRILTQRGLIRAFGAIRAIGARGAFRRKGAYSNAKQCIWGIFSNLLSEQKEHKDFKAKREMKKYQTYQY